MDERGSDRRRAAFDLEHIGWTLHVMLGEFPSAGMALGDTLDRLDKDHRRHAGDVIGDDRDTR